MQMSYAYINTRIASFPTPVLECGATGTGAVL